MPIQEILTNIIDLIEDAEGERLTSDEIRDTFKIEETTTGNYNTRRLVKDAMREIGVKKGIPIGADSTGYFLITKQIQLTKYIANLEGRIKGIRERQDLVLKAWAKRG